MPSPARLTRYAARPLGAVAAGLALWLGFPTHDLWWLAPVGVALLAGVTWRQRFRVGLGLGLLAGWACFVPTLSWSGVYVGAVPWLALATLQALYVALMGGLVSWGTSRLRPAKLLVPPSGAPDARRYLLIPLGWVAQELARSTTPWGGFPWARLAFGQTGGPLVNLAAWGGAPLVTFAVAVVGAQLLYAAHALRTRRVVETVVVAATTLVWVALVGVALRPTLPDDGRPETVGYVQGNVPHPGLDFNAERRAVLDNHVKETERLAATSPQGLELVVWPENSSDIDPFRNSDADAQIRRAQQSVGVPLLVGAVLAEPVDHNSNVSLLYRPGGGEPERYTKLHPVPFAEYIPYRSFFRVFSKEADLAGNFVAGTDLGAFRVQGRQGGGEWWALPTICFEVAYDGLVRDSVLNPEVGSDPSLLVVQTNNATFGYTAESEQQFAISRLRAIEHGRSIVHVSTVGVSGFIAPDGTVSAKSGLFEPASAVGAPVVSSQVTLSDRLGSWPERVLVLAFVLSLASGFRRDHHAGHER